MPELPEIVLRAREMDAELTQRTFARAELYQPKCVNLPPAEFAERVVGATIQGASHRGKWMFVHLGQQELLLNLGMGGEILFHRPDEPLPEKLQALFTFTDGSHLSLHFWWFGYIHLVAQAELPQHKMTAGLGLDPLSDAFTVEALTGLISGRKTRIKSILLDQNQIAGIGNMYSHDILFRARLHPLRLANSLTAEETAALLRSIRETLQGAVDLGGTHWEQNLYGQGGSFDMDCLLVGYKEGQPCPACGTTVVKIKTGSTASFICPACQTL